MDFRLVYHKLSFYWYLSLFLTLSIAVHGQGEEGSCAGSLGENIFVDGDFGIGTSNLISTNPQIAPGYNYTTNVPPGDGFYTITNNMAQWPNLYSAWLPIRDNSSDPNGYMMVVNAGFSPGIFYEQSVTGLCPNTQYEFSADIINVIRTVTANHILPNVDFVLDGQVILSTGNIPQSEEWNHYSYLFFTGENETDLVLSLINNAPGGNGNDLALDNISFRACGPSARIVGDDIIENVCLAGENSSFILEADVEDDTYTFYQWQFKRKEDSVWQDIEGANQRTYELTNLSSGEYEYRYILANAFGNLQNPKCQLVSTIKEINATAIEYTTNTTICEGVSLEVGTSIYTMSGIYVDALVSSTGCDSIVTTNLTVLEEPNMEALIEVTNPNCVGDSDASIEVREVTGGTPPYTYFLDEMENTIGVFNFLAAGNYPLEITDQYGCNFQTLVVVEEPEPLVVETDDLVQLFFGQSTILNTSVNYTDVSYQWTPSNGLSCDNCPTPTAIPFETTDYQLLVQNQNGCLAETSIRIEVDNTFPLGIPTAFSPNEDGINDFFEITTPFVDAIEEMKQMKIFNRWGQEIYSTTETIGGSVLARWDGRRDFRLLDLGVYVYLLELQLIDGSVQIFSGTVSIMY
ncbi:MAG: gliding motility-associated C-terminal domain-containing protein [Chitinophagales bacterium]